MKIHLKKFLSGQATLIFALACFALSPQAQAVCQEGCDSSLFNAFLGDDALINNTSGAGNTALGWRSLFSNTDASFNTGVGGGALALNNGTDNTAVGAAALLLNTTGNFNTAVGTDALVYNDSGNFNTANGAFALFNHTTGDRNTAVGTQALFSDTEGTDNTATGYNALNNNLTGVNNTANGGSALFGNTTGVQNTAVGFFALLDSNGDNNTAVGTSALPFTTTGSGNTALGFLAGSAVTDANSVIAIGTDGENVSNSCYIGQIYSNIQPPVGIDPDTVTINSSGRLGRANVSSRRYKHDIQPMETASEAIYALRPVSFRYHKQYDVTQTLAFGLIAEDVAEVNSDLVGRNPKGQPESVRYEQINAMLLNEFLKEHRTVEELKSTVAKQEATIAKQQKQIEALTAGLQKVSAQLEVSKPLPQTVSSNQ